ncbi:hypothetical protein [Microbacterium sp. UBA3486]|uniref:hypothetical protein n=1 Tax=Microbacterium sp. UBA3486 TaxID=1946947 RepID=UPI0025EB5964|nr:hypothetical protein [Microbacterium sp. UBA3486]
MIVSERLEKQVEFLDRLIQLTEQGKVRWRNQRTEYWFTTELNRFAYAIICRDEDDVAPYLFRVFRLLPSGEVDTTMLEEWMWNFEGDDHPLDERLARLYRVVKRATIGYSELVDGMLQDISEIDGLTDGI